MSIAKALEIEKIVPVQNGIYVCTDAKNKKFELMPLEKISITLNDKRKIVLGDLILTILETQAKLQENCNLIVKAHNELLESFKQKVIMDSIDKIGGKRNG
ncbi:MAG: hypothetical protein NC087_01950 [Anaeroplasma bactoclasticum]|nr:hypothetical protein [Anaeroplasma bactoclasticum]